MYFADFSYILAGLVLLNFGLLIWLLIKGKKESGLSSVEGDKITQKIDYRITMLEQSLRKEQVEFRDKLHEVTLKNIQSIQSSFNAFSIGVNKNQLQALESIQNTLKQAVEALEQKVNNILTSNTQSLTEGMDKLAKTTESRLLTIGEQVDKKLNAGFEKSTATFTDIIKRLAIIDDAQKRITALSDNVVSLQQILADKRSRGAFGEVQLNALISNMLPENSYAFQHTFKNGTRADCAIFLPKPTGTIVVDSKFPLESYQIMTDHALAQFERDKAKAQFKQDVKKHIKDIENKYIIPNETSDGAIMFIPAEAIFAEIHAHHPDLVELSLSSRVWLASPTTVMAILTTARAVLKDDATKQQVHVIQEHLRLLSQDFVRFNKRMDTLAKHINQANTDVEQVQTSAKKISQRFVKIDEVELMQEEQDKLL